MLSGFAALGALPEPKFRAVNVDTNVAIGYGIAVADVDGDKRPDIVLCDKNQIAWYRNPSWEKFVIAENLTPKDHVCVAAADIDGDGKAEIAVGAEWNPGDTVDSGAVFYLIAPADRTQRWEPVKLPHEPTVHRMRWMKDDRGQFELVVVPLHGRGNNAQTGEGEAVKILRYVRPADPRTSWTVTPMTQPSWTRLHKTHNFDPIPVRQASADIMAVAAKEGVFLVPDGSPTQITLIGTNAIGGAGEVRRGKLPGKGFFAAVEPMHGNTLSVYLPGLTSSAPFERLVLDESLVDGHALACGDLLGLGRDQVVVGWRAMNRPGVKVGLRLYTPLDATGKEWRMTPVDDNTMACEDLALADLNLDGRLDIIAAGRATKNLKIWFNEP
ncbi:MAG TPA: hypothetical protein DCE44_05350 [Verrucomicrobiales bacterium]|nr:hypothetical protein [Verrucomicrobiales bacterium]